MTPARRPLSLWGADLAVVVVIAIWYFAARKLPDFVLPGPVAVAERLALLFVDPDFLVHTLASTLRVIVSVFVALVLGGALALLQRGMPALDWVLRGGIVPFLSSFPSIGWAILAAIWFPAGHLSIIFVQVAILVPFCFINIAEGLAQIDRDMVEMATSFTRRPLRRLWLVTLPLTMPYVIGALRIAYGIAWKISLVAELLGSSSGLGYVMLRAQGSADLTTVLAASFAIVILFIAGETWVLAPLARRYAPR